MNRPGTGRIARLKWRLIVEGKLGDFRKTGDLSILRDKGVFADAVRLARAARDASPQDVASLVASGRYFLARYLSLQPAEKQDLDVAVEIFAEVARHDQALVPEEIVTLTAKAPGASRATQSGPRVADPAADAAKAAADRGKLAIRQAEAASDRTAAELAITELSEAVRLAEGSPWAQPAYLNNLSYAWAVMFDLTGDLDDLDRGIAVVRRSLAILPPADPSRAVVLNSLGAMLLTRSERSGEPPDLDASIEALREARSLLNPASYCAPANVSNLGRRCLTGSSATAAGRTSTRQSSPCGTRSSSFPTTRPDGQRSRLTWPTPSSSAPPRAAARCRT